MTAPEYTVTHPDNRSFVTGLYHDIYERNPDAAGFSFWVNVLQSGSRTRAAVVYYFLTATEAYLQAIDSYYVEFLGRHPSAQEADAYLALLIDGATPASITAIFLSSEEYINRQFALEFGR